VSIIMHVISGANAITYSFMLKCNAQYLIQAAIGVKVTTVVNLGLMVSNVEL
jgi:hypothetical protein